MSLVNQEVSINQISRFERIDRSENCGHEMSSLPDEMYHDVTLYNENPKTLPESVRCPLNGVHNAEVFH